MEDSVRHQTRTVAARRFLQEITIEIGRQDPTHFRMIDEHLKSISLQEGPVFYEILKLIYSYFREANVSTFQLATDYLRMVGDMRREYGYFILYGKYSCKSQAEADEKVYSRPEIMSYYMNGLILSQLLWRHHFEMIRYFRNTVQQQVKRYVDVLDIGAGHGLYSYFVREHIPVNTIDIVDISSESLKMTQDMIGSNSINYILSDINNFWSQDKYDLIILGEVLEHLDNPLDTLVHAKEMLREGGVIWLTVPTKAPAIDHVYLFRSKTGVFSMVRKAGLKVNAYLDLRASRITHLIGAFCVKK